LIEISNERLDSLRKEVPERWEVLVENFGKKFDLPNQLAEPLFDSEYKALFEKIVASSKGISPRYVASIFVDTFQSISRDGIDVYSLENERISQLFEALSSGKFAKEAMPSLIKVLASDKESSIQSALAKLGFSSMNIEELKGIVASTLDENKSLVEQKGKQGARGAIMGRVMQKVRGKADGKLVSEMVDSFLEEYANEKINQ
jgi:glutamyl-tRNA(Gln) amidotransferase subunit E